MNNKSVSISNSKRITVKRKEKECNFTNSLYNNHFQNIFKRDLNTISEPQGLMKDSINNNFKSERIQTKIFNNKMQEIQNSGSIDEIFNQKLSKKNYLNKLRSTSVHSQRSISKEENNPENYKCSFHRFKINKEINPNNISIINNSKDNNSKLTTKSTTPNSNDITTNNKNDGSEIKVNKNYKYNFCNNPVIINSSKQTMEISINPNNIFELMSYNQSKKNNFEIKDKIIFGNRNKHFSGENMKHIFQTTIKEQKGESMKTQDKNNPKITRNLSCILNYNTNKNTDFDREKNLNSSVSVKNICFSNRSIDQKSGSLRFSNSTKKFESYDKITNNNHDIIKNHTKETKTKIGRKNKNDKFLMRKLGFYV